MRRRSLRGFTLIELLVVISIIALLVAILLPALRSARTVAQRTKSVSNIRQVMIGLINYTSDNDGSYPWIRFDTNNDGDAKDWDEDFTWAAKLREGEYVTGKKAWYGPGRNWTAIENKAHNHYKHPAFAYPGYTANAFGVMPSLSDLENYGLHPLRTGSVSPPPTRVLVLTTQFHASYYDNIDGRFALGRGEQLLQAGPDVNNSDPLLTYNGGLPQAYLDGHASGSEASTVLPYEPHSARTGFWSWDDYGQIYGRPTYHMRGEGNYW